MIKEEDIQLIIDNNKGSMYNYTKLSEELFELGEVLLQTVNKKGDYRPSLKKIIEESGDVILRLHILCLSLGIADKVNERANTKMNKILKLLEEGKYKGEI